MKNNFTLFLRFLGSIILLQTLYFKFSGSLESKFIFSSLGVEPWGRWLAGISELIAGLLLLISATQVLGALMGLGIMIGAILSHLFVLGIEVHNDGGFLFILATVVLISCGLIIYLQRSQIPILITRTKTLAYFVVKK
jgi:hypothetical protein